MEMLKENKIQRILLIICSIYIIVSAGADITTITAILSENLIKDFKSGILVLSSMMFIVLALVTNYKIIRGTGNFGRLCLINIFTVGVQILYFKFNGFQFQWIMGAEINAYFLNLPEENKGGLGFGFQNFHYLFKIRFEEMDYSVVGVNLLSLFLFLYYLMNLNEYRKHKNLLS